jgi:hypothetical protein
MKKLQKEKATNPILVELEMISKCKKQLQPHLVKNMFSMKAAEKIKIGINLKAKSKLKHLLVMEHLLEMKFSLIIKNSCFRMILKYTHASKCLYKKSFQLN